MLFRPEQADPFFDNLQTYRDRRIWLSMGNAWLELEKRNSADNAPLYVVGTSFPGDTSESVAKGILNVFDSRMVPVEASNAHKRKLPGINPISTKALNFLLSTLYKKSRGPSRKVETLINSLSLWRPEQLPTLAHWINSYRDSGIELQLYSGRTEARIQLQKHGRRGGNDQRYWVVGSSTSDGKELTDCVTDLFPINGIGSAVKTFVTNKYRDGNWKYCKIPLPIDEFVSNIARKYDEKRRYINEN
jgi:hypothetical protein